jgi:hypothetical protein
LGTHLPETFVNFGDEGSPQEHSVPLRERPPMETQPSSGGGRSGVPGATPGA